MSSSADPPKLEHPFDASPRGSSKSVASSPEFGPETPGPGTEGSNPQDPPIVQKRKGGRKPIYATSEERKQRNRQAQAAFRERRTEYIKQLEITIKQNEDNLQTLQQSHRAAADECLMLRYKNSLLERILLEKGIDVQTELQSKSDGPLAGPNTDAPATVNAPPIQRAMLHRQQQHQQQQQNQHQQQHHHQQQEQQRFAHAGATQKSDYGFRMSQSVPQDYSTRSDTTQSAPTSLTQQTGFTTQQTNMLPPLDHTQTQHYPHFQHLQASQQPLQPSLNPARAASGSFVNRMPDYPVQSMVEYASPISGEGDDQSPYYPYMEINNLETSGKLPLPFSPYSE